MCACSLPFISPGPPVNRLGPCATKTQYFDSVLSKQRHSRELTALRARVDYVWGTRARIVHGRVTWRGADEHRHVRYKLRDVWNWKIQLVSSFLITLPYQFIAMRRSISRTAELVLSIWTTGTPSDWSWLCTGDISLPKDISLRFVSAALIRLCLCFAVIEF